MQENTRLETGVSRPCQVCGEPSKKRLIYRQRFAMPSQNAVHGGYDVVVCQHCGFAFADHAPSQNTLDAYYHARAKKDEMLDASADYLESQETMDRNNYSATQIAPLIKRGDRVLDIGCYTGYLLSVISKQVEDCQALGLDPSSFAASVGRRRHGVDIRVGTIFDMPDTGQFDVVICSHILEHLAELRPFLARLRCLLRSDGRLYIEVPDATRFDSEMDNQGQRAEPFFEFNFEHINYFSPDTLRNLFEANGFESVSLSRGSSTLPVVASVWSPKTITRSTEPANSLLAYIEASATKNARAAAVVRALALRTNSYVVWGAGAHTQRLLAENVIDPGKVAYFVDANPDLHGATLSGRPICPPETLKANPSLPVLISSYRHERVIMERLASDNFPNEVVPMYSWLNH